MHSPFRTRGAILAGLLALALAAFIPTAAAAKPEPGAKKPQRGFRLFAAPLGAMTINNVYCGLNSTGEVCVDSTNSSTIGGGYWPKGTADQYIFNSGLQIAGVVGPDGGSWAGDTTGAFFFDPKGTTQHGLGIQPVYNSSNPSDLANWPAAAYVPGLGDNGAANFNPILQGSAVASQGDVWFMSWDGDPSLNAGRKHPLGVAVETRGMGWNFPSDNRDIIYFIYTFYNITSTNPADYVGIRPSMQAILLQAAQDFQAKNNAAFNVVLPTDGYTIEQMYAAFATDMDVAQAGVNYSSVNLPFALGYTYVQNFAGEVSWSFPSSLFSPPFFQGAGFSGIKYLKSPTGPGAIQLFSNTVNGTPFAGAFNDPQNTIQLYRYLSGNISVAAGDQPCNTGSPLVSHICWLNNTQAADMRFFQSSTALTLPPGGSGSIVVAYIFAAPVAVGGCPASGDACGGGNLKPGNATILGNPAAMATGVNLVDSISGYLGFDDLDLDGNVEQNGDLGPEWSVVSGSLLGKAYTAQAVFDVGFLLPDAPDSPNFFLIPGDNNVTIAWQPSASETTPDQYYTVTQDVNSFLYDPNYREFDVEGYRIYRGRVDSPDQLFLVAQFDFAGTIFDDYNATVNPVGSCAPELGIFTDCPVNYDSVIPGQPRTVSNPNNIVSPFLQTKYGKRVALASGAAYSVAVDTAITGEDSGLPPLDNSGIPYVYVDNTVRNNFRYFYVVTAFDVNSWQSAPSSLESPKSATQAVIPQAPASNYENTATFSSGIYGRNVALDYTSTPVINATTGRFGGIMPASNAWTIGFEAFVPQVIQGTGNFAVRLDSMDYGSAYELPAAVAGTYYYSAINGPDTTQLSLALTQAVDVGVASGSATFNAVAFDSSLASVYGGDGNYYMKGQVSVTLVGNYYTNSYGRGCVNGADGYTEAAGCQYNGPRWFAGPSPANNETMNDPNYGNYLNFTPPYMVDVAAPNNTGWNNAGALPGVTVVHQPYSYNTMGNQWRDVEGVGGFGKRQADYNVYWGTGGFVDSVIDATHNVPVPFDSLEARGGWGILNQAAAQPSGVGQAYDQRSELTLTDVGCVEPYRSFTAAQGRIACGTAAAGDGPVYVLSQTAVPGPIAEFTGSPSDARTRAAAPEAGFAMLIGGNMFMFQLTGGTVPTAGTIWSMRDYVGAISGGNGWGGPAGPYSYHGVPRPFSAIGAELRANYDVVNQVNAASNAGLAKIHTVPDPYYVTNEYESDFTAKVIKFVNLPSNAIVRIYSSSGVLVRVLQQNSTQNGGMLDWNVRNRSNQVVASGVYFYHVEAGDARFVGRMTIVNFAR